jgi:hypothetical protein
MFLTENWLHWKQSPLQLNIKSKLSASPPLRRLYRNQHTRGQRNNGNGWGGGGGVIRDNFFNELFFSSC